jgi:hypothetical protein
MTPNASRPYARVSTAEPRQQADWSGETWCTALASHYFRAEDAQLPVLFFVDGPVLASIHAGSEHESIASLCAAVQANLNGPGSSGYFHSLEQRGRIWSTSRSESPPPFLHLLALCVLAATRMGTGGSNPTNYRAHLGELLGLSTAEWPKGFHESVYFMWRWLDEWLDKTLGGARGLSTIADDARLTHIGYPLSQTLFRRSDVRRLDDFFRWFGLEVGEVVGEDVLVAHFRAWAELSELSPGARTLVSDESRQQLLGRILTAYAKSWDGTQASREGDRRGELRVVVGLGVPAKIWLRARQPSGYPARLRGELIGRQVVAEAEDEVFEVIGPVDPRQLLRGVDLRAGGARLVLRGSPVHILIPDEELGGWASVEQIQAGARHLVLAAPAAAEEVERVLQAATIEPAQIQSGPGALSAWTLFRNVVVRDGASLGGHLGEQVATRAQRFTLRGGLPLAPTSSYLAGGPPDVHLPVSAVAGDLLVDGRPVPVRDGCSRLSAELPSRGGRHVVRFAGAVEARILTVDSTVRFPRSEIRLGHHLQMDEAGALVGYTPAAALKVGAPGVSGTHVYVPGQEWRRAPVLLARRALARWCLGSGGQVEQVEPPAEPAWLKRKGLPIRVFEHRADFDVQYVVEQWKEDLRIREVSTLDPMETAGQAPSAALWARLLVDARPAGPCDLALLEAYRGTGKALLTDAAP